MGLLFLIHISLLYWILFTFAWWLAKKRNDLSIVQYFWGLGAIICVYDGVFNLHEQKSKSIVLFVMALLWGFRLLTCLFFQSRGKGEERVYSTLRTEWIGEGKKVWSEAYKKIFLVSGFLNFILCAPFWFHYARGTDRWNFINYLGILFFITGFFLEVYADIMIYQYKKLKITGGDLVYFRQWPWNECKNPYACGEILLWWGVFLTSIQNFFDIWIGISALLVTGLVLKESYRMVPYFFKLKKPELK